MMDERGNGMKCGEDDQRVGHHFMNLLHRASECTVSKPRRSYFSQSKDRQSVATRELQDYPGNWSCEQKHIEGVMSKPSSAVEPCA